MFGHFRSTGSSRSKWAAVGAAVAVVVGAGSILSASASGSTGASSFVPITPCRLLDTRATDVVGARSTPLTSSESYITPVWGTNGNCTIPVGATGVSMDVVAVNPTGSSYLTVFPADQPRPLSSNLNWVAFQAATPNAVTVAVSADGRIGFFNNAGTVDIAVDIVGFYEPSSSGPAGPPGPTGPTGPTGLIGPVGPDGSPGVTPAHVVWVATAGGNFTSVTAALASITTNSAINRFVVKVAPGNYIESAPVVLKNYVDIEGSGEGTTTITCACGGASDPSIDGAAAALRASGLLLHAEVRHLTVANTGGGINSVGIWTGGVLASVSLLHVTSTATGGTNNYGIVNLASSAILDDINATATNGNAATGIADYQSIITLTNVNATGTGGFFNIGVSNEIGSTATMNNVNATSGPGGGASYGVLVHQSVVAIRDSYITSANLSIYKINDATSKVLVLDTKLGGNTAGLAAANCINAFDTSLNPYTCI